MAKSRNNIYMTLEHSWLEPETEEKFLNLESSIMLHVYQDAGIEAKACTRHINYVLPLLLAFRTKH